MMTASIPLQGATRVLTVLRALNLHNDTTVMALHRHTGLSRPSLYRLLDTLQSAGYVTRHPQGDRYRLTHLVRTLSDGYDDEAWVRDIAAPIIDVLQAKVIWPTDLATFLNDAMYLRETTRRRSPFTIDRATVGFRLPLLETANGCAYLAYCPPRERAAILENLRQSPRAEDALAAHPRRVERLLTQTRERGYAVRTGAFMPETGSIAIPVMAGARVLATIGITFIASAISPGAIAQRYLDDLESAARQIETEIGRQGALL